MKKVILLSAFILTLASCSAPAPEAEVPAVDTTCCAKADTACTLASTAATTDTAQVK